MIKIFYAWILACVCVMSSGYGEPMKCTEPTETFVFAKDKTYFAIIYTSKGKIECQLFPEQAPLSVTNFKQLIDAGFYNGLVFHRVIANFVIQSGDPTGTGAGGPGYTLPAEIGLKHELGALAWARLPETDRDGRILNPHKRSSGSQFYITLDKTSFLDGGYTVFGQTISGFDVIQNVKQGDKIERIEWVVR